MITDEELIQMRDDHGVPQMQRDMAAELIQHRDAARMWSYPGIALSSTSHPRAPFWSRVWSWFFPPKLHADALETVELDLSDTLDLGSGEGLTYIKFPLPAASNRVEEQVRWRLNDGDGALLRAFIEDDIVREPSSAPPIELDPVLNAERN